MTNGFGPLVHSGIITGRPFSADIEDSKPTKRLWWTTQHVVRGTIARDALGRVRMDYQIARGARLASIVDPVTGKMYVLHPKKDAVMETSPFPGQEIEYKHAPPALDGLQTRMIEGLECYQLKLAAQGLEAWISTDLGVCIEESLTGECGVSTWRLSNVVLGEPDPARFVAP